MRKDTVYCQACGPWQPSFSLLEKGGHRQCQFVVQWRDHAIPIFMIWAKGLVLTIQQMANRLGLGKKTGIDFPHERSGLIPSRSWKMATRNVAWQQGETLITAIGQGYVLASPMQLAVMIARVANGGYEVSPHIVQRPSDHGATGPQGRSLDFRIRWIWLCCAKLCPPS